MCVQAILLLESFVREDPPRHMTEVVVQNLLCMYELTADRAGRDRRLRVLEGVAARFRLDDLTHLFAPASSPPPAPPTNTTAPATTSTSSGAAAAGVGGGVPTAAPDSGGLRQQQQQASYG